jgi:hypothetical protein
VRSTRLVLIVSIAIAGALMVWLRAPEWRGLPTVTGAAAIVGWLLGRTAPKPVAGLTLAVGYLAPVLFAVLLGRFYDPYLVVWMAALLSVIVARAPLKSWSLPSSWQAPIALWSLVIALSWPVIVLREYDFVPPVLLFSGGNAVASRGGFPQGVAMWVLGVALSQGLGLLWLDWLCGHFNSSDLRQYRKFVLAPLGVSAALGAMLGVYQGFVNMGTLSAGRWPLLRRAAGSLLDANASGTLFALWCVGLLALALPLERRWKIAAGAGSILAGAAVWASGSRTASLAAVIGLGGAGIAAWRALKNRRARSRFVAAIAGGGLLLVAIAAWLEPSVDNPVARARSMLPDDSVSMESVRRVGLELWHRNGYGTAAVRVIGDFPLVGGGLGSFHTLSTDYAKLAGVAPVPPDNAQNWFRHQLAELGFLGSLGWMSWVAMFGWLLISTRGTGERAAESGIVKGLLVAIGLTSLLGMPTQSPAVALTFWTFAFWYVLLVDSPALRHDPARTPREIRAPWPLVWAIAIVFVAGTAYVAATDLRVPYRALRADWYYVSGLSKPVVRPDGVELRTTEKKAVEVFPVEKHWLKLTIWANHPDAERDPVEIKIWRNRELILRAVARDATPITRYVQAPAGQRRMMIQTWVERTWRPGDFGKPDSRPRGLSVAKWEWLDTPPPGVPLVRTHGD